MRLESAPIIPAPPRVALSGENAVKSGGMLTVVTMGLAVPEPDALGQPLSEGLYPGVGSNPSTIVHYL